MSNGNKLICFVCKKFHKVNKMVPLYKNVPTDMPTGVDEKGGVKKEVKLVRTLVGYVCVKKLQEKARQIHAGKQQ